MKSNPLNVILGFCVVVLISIFGYFTLNWLVFLNVVEEQLPESEEKIPDLGIVENTTVDESE